MSKKITEKEYKLPYFYLIYNKNTEGFLLPSVRNVSIVMLRITKITKCFVKQWF